MLQSFILLADFSVIKPDPGLLVWTSVFFLLVWFLLGKLAFKPIQKALKEREVTIQSSLDEAKRAKEEMMTLKSENEKLLAQAREERTRMLKEAEETKQQIIKEAKERAKADAAKIVETAQNEISNMKSHALVEVKNQVGNIALEIAEKVLREKLQGQPNQEAYVAKLLDEMNIN